MQGPEYLARAQGPGCKDRMQLPGLRRVDARARAGNGRKRGTVMQRRTENGLLVWDVGDVTITRVVETGMEMPLAAFEGADAEILQGTDWLQDFLTENGNPDLSFHTFAVQVGDLRILVDTCNGNDKVRGGIFEVVSGLATPYLSVLQEIGFAREDVDFVVCTHLHFDHVGWNTMLVEGEWVPTFPNARYVFVQEELEHWASLPDMPLHGDAFVDSVQPVLDAGLVDLVGHDHQVCEGLSLHWSPGHSPGHVCVRIESGEDLAFITGDSLHHPMQIAYPDWFLRFADTNSAKAVETRERLLGDWKEAGVLVLGTHFMAPTAGYIRADGQKVFFSVEP